MLSSSCSVQSFSFLLKSTLALNMYSDVEMYVFILFLFVTLLLSKYNRIRFVNAICIGSGYNAIHAIHTGARLEPHLVLLLCLAASFSSIAFDFNQHYCCPCVAGATGGIRSRALLGYWCSYPVDFSIPS